MPHIRKDIDYAVAAYIVHGMEVLLAHHKKLGAWVPIGGHVELGENPEETLFREIQEECGLKIILAPVHRKPSLTLEEHRFLYPPYYLDVHRIDEKHWHIGMVYFAQAMSRKTRIEPGEHRALRWFSYGELADQYTVPQNVRFYAREAIRKIGKYRTYQGQLLVTSNRLTRSDWKTICAVWWTEKQKKILDRLRAHPDQCLAVRDAGLERSDSPIQTINAIFCRRFLPYTIRRNNTGGGWPDAILKIYKVKRET